MLCLPRGGHRGRAARHRRSTARRWTPDVRRTLSALPAASGSSMGQPGLSRNMHAVLQAAQDLANQRGDAYVSTEHLLIGIAEKQPDLLPVEPAKLLDALSQVAGDRRVTNQDPEASFQALEKYGVDLTERAREGKIDPVIGRDAEIRRVMQVLSDARRTTPSSSASPASARRPWSRVSPSGSSPAMCPSRCATRPDLARSARHGRRCEVPRRSSRSGSSPCSKRSSNPTGRSSRSSTNCTPSSAPVPPVRARSTPATCSSPCSPAVSSGWSAPPRSTSTASTSRRTPRSSAGSSRCWSASRVSRRPSASCAGSRRSTRRTTRWPSPTPPWWPRPPSRTATSLRASCRTRPSTSSMRRPRGCGWRSTPARRRSTNCSARSTA